MTVSKKIEKAPIKEAEAEEKIKRMIEGGGNVAADDLPTGPEEIKFTLRLKAELAKAIDEKRKSRPGSISRHQWIIESLTKSIQ